MPKGRNHDAGFKARVAPEAAKGGRIVPELAAEYRVRPTMIHQWKKALLEGASDIFERGGKKAGIDEATMRSLHARIGKPAGANASCPESPGPGPASDEGSKPPPVQGRSRTR
ncbi:hypothetical protein BDE18_3085 [Paracoccus pantotrophus]|uniref:Transposase n=2 Tax=Paracoccus TaxID=265 RepID=A0AAE6NS05_PARPN|nr:transposase [Paracoccus pantotrophus]QFG35526.1 transposase [Paracoccus pantotrophus]RKS44244.1 hypothetical protein BDE18_3085 [Paracoccus pantotrophus]